MISPRVLATEIGNGKFRPAYYFFGAEDYRITEGVKFLAGAYLTDSQRRTNVKRLDCHRDSLADLLNELATLPLLGERRVVVLGQAQGLRPKQLSSVLDLLDPPDDNRVVIFTSPSSVLVRGRKAFTSRAFYRDISKVVAVVEFGRLTPAEVAGMIKRKIEAAGLSAEPEAMRLLQLTIGGNRGALESEVAKLVDFKTDSSVVSLADVRSVCSGYEVFNVFDLADQIVAGATGRVIRMLDRLIADGQSPIGIMGLLQAHFLSLYQVQGGHRLTGPRAWLNKRYASQAARYTPDRLEQIICDLADADAELRGGALKPEMTLETLIVGLME